MQPRCARRMQQAGTGCGTCQPLLNQLIDLYAPESRTKKKELNKIELIKQEKNGLDCCPTTFTAWPQHNNWQEMTEADKHRFKWYGLFFGMPTPGNFMLRLRAQAGKINAAQFRVIADLSDEYGKGFCDLTTRQQIQLRWFTLGDVPESGSGSTRSACTASRPAWTTSAACAAARWPACTPHELLDATAVIEELNDILIGNKEFTNLPRKFNVTITGCLENCCHPETQDIGLVPAHRELDGQQVNGFNVLVGGKQGSGGYRPATPLDVFTRPEDAARLCAEITRIFRDHGSRATRSPRPPGFPHRGSRHRLVPRGAAAPPR